MRRWFATGTLASLAGTATRALAAGETTAPQTEGVPLVPAADPWALVLLGLGLLAAAAAFIRQRRRSA